MADTSDKRIKSAIAYLGWWVTGIALLLIEKEDKDIRFHAMQSTVTFGAITLLYIVLGIIPILGWLIAVIISPGVMVVSFVLWLILMWKAYSGEKYKLPYFGNIAEKQLEKMK
jgi:uncharacterized membrane protein